MKNMFLILPLVMFMLGACEKKELHLMCKTGVADASANESYDVRVRFIKDGAILTVDGAEYELRQEYDAPVVFSRVDPWYNLQIGNRQIGTKYALGVPTNEGFARYTVCEEVK